MSSDVATELRAIVAEMHGRIEHLKQELNDAYRLMGKTAQKSIRCEDAIRAVLDSGVVPEGDLKRRLQMVIK